MQSIDGDALQKLKQEMCYEVFLRLMAINEKD